MRGNDAPRSIGDGDRDSADQYYNMLFSKKLVSLPCICGTSAHRYGEYQGRSASVGGRMSTTVFRETSPELFSVLFLPRLLVKLLMKFVVGRTNPFELGISVILGASVALRRSRVGAIPC